MTKSNLLEISNLNFQFLENKKISLKKIQKKNVNNTLVLKQINLKLEKNLVYGVIGANGSGKSTLLKIVFNLLNPTNGLINRHFNSGKLLSEPYFFHEELNGIDNFKAYYSLGNSEQIDSEVYVKKFLKFQNISQLSNNDLEKPVSNLSKGMKAKIGFGLTMAFLDNTDFIGLDEFFSFGDDSYKLFSSNYIKKEIKSSGSAILVSHSMQLIESMCDAVILLHNGELINFDKPENVIREYLNLIKK